MPALPKDWPAVLFTHLVAVACCGVAGWFVHSQGSDDLPYSDEWALLDDYLTRGRNPLGWALVPHNEHRYPLAKLLWVGCLEATGFRFRTPMYLTVGLQTAAGVLLLWAARGARGRAHPADALLPVLALNLGHSFNLIMGYQVGFAAFLYAVAGWVWSAGRLARGGGWGWAALAGVYGGVLVQTGGFGLVFTPPLAGWAGYAAWWQWRTGRRAGAAVTAACAVAWCGYSFWVWRTMSGLATTPAAEDRAVWGMAASVVGYLSNGSGDWSVGPHLGPRAVSGGLAVAAYLVGGAVLVGGWAGRQARGPFAAALLAVLVGVVLLAGATGYARGYGMGGRFVGPSACGLIAAALALAPLTPRCGWKSVIYGLAGVAAAVAVFWVNVEPGLRHGYYTRVAAGPFRDDLAAGVPPVFLAGRYGGTIAVGNVDRTAGNLRTYRRAGVGVFAGLADDPPFEVVPVPGVGVPFEFESRPAAAPTTVTIPDPTAAVLGLRMLVDNHVPAGWQRVWLRWRDADTGAEREWWAFPPWTENRMHLTFSITGRPTAVRFVADDGVVCPFTVEAVEWMVPK